MSTVRSPRSASSPEYGLLSREGVANPLPYYHALRHESPVFWSDLLQAWLVTGYEDVVRAFRHPSLSSARLEVTIGAPLKAVPHATPADLLRITAAFLSMKDGPAHAASRKWASRGFGPLILAGWRGVVEQVTDRIVASLSNHRGVVDIVTAFAELLPARVLAAIFDVSPADEPFFHHNAARVAGFFTGSLSNLEENARSGNLAMAALEDYFKARIVERRRSPGDDLLSIWTANQEGAPEDDEIAALCISMLVGGNITTADQIALGVPLFLRHPDQVRQVRERPELMKTAVEELVRFDGSVPFMHRLVVSDLELGGQVLKKGQLAFLGITAANHDPAIFPDPDRFDIHRASARHIGYGTGRHSCLGINLARIELEVGLGALVRQFPGLRLDEERPGRVRFNLLTRGYESLLVKL